MKITFFQISILKKFVQLVKDLTYNLDMTLSFVLDIDENIIQIHNNKDIKFFYKDFINIVLEDC